MPVEIKTVSESEDGIRLDRWFKRHYPDLPHSLLEKLLRKKNIRLNNQKALSCTHLSSGDLIRIPSMDCKKIPSHENKLTQKEISFAEEMLLYKDKDILVLNKPAGLAVQGGTKTNQHIDRLLGALKYDYDEKPRLVHRLDKETSGVLVVARTAQSAAYLSKLFKTKEVHKTYWALVAGRPTKTQGKIDAPLIQKNVGLSDFRTVDPKGQSAVSLYQEQDHLANQVSWLQMSPLTGRTHQLRIHAAKVLKTPIIGDTKYGSKADFPLESSKMFLHARALSFPLPNGKMLLVQAPIPVHFKQAFQTFGFSEKGVSPSFSRSTK